jgi:hypothetical protein
MKRFCFFLALMVLSSSAHAGSFSFVVAGHRIRIEAPRHCRSASCVSVSIPGIYYSNRWRDRDDEVAAAPQPAPQPAPAPANPPAPVAAPAAPAVTRASQAPVAAPPSQPPVQPVASVAPPPLPPPPVPPTAPAPQLAGTTARIIVLPPPPQPAPAAPVVSTTQAIAPPPPKAEPAKTTPVEPPPAAAPKPIPVPVPVPPISRISQETEDGPADTPLGDWQTEGNKGTVRVERCGEAMCGYILNLTSNAKGDTILINMKPKPKLDAVWSGNIYSRSSGHTYYATMTMKGVNTLRVEACALGHFFCSGNDWTRIDKASKLITSRQTSSQPPS